MAYKEIENENRKVLIYRQKSPVQIGYEYFITVLSKGAFSTWNVDSSYKQKLPIHSERRATEIATEILKQTQP